MHFLYNRWSRRLRRNIVILLSLIATSGSVAVKAQEAQSIDQVRQLFQNPPADSRVMMRWWWFGPSITKEEIAKELKAMKEGGIGGVEIAHVYPLALDDPSTGFRNMSFLSDDDIKSIRYANETAHSLGMRVDVTLCSGWPYGGPSVPIDQAAGMLRVEHIKLSGSEQNIPTPHLEGGEKFEAAFVVHNDGKSIDPATSHPITEISGNVLPLPAEHSGANEVLVFISSRTKQQVKRPSFGAEGNVLDHYDPAALKDYLSHVGDRLLQAFDDKPPYAIFCDSLEVFGTNWTPNLLNEFKKRRGYDLTPYLPALVTDYGPHTADIRRDWGQTLTELLNDNFIQPLNAWAASHHTRLRMQAYGVPPATLSSYQSIDLPEGEGPRWKVIDASRWAASASHVYGRAITSAETWTWLHSPAFAATPLDMKEEAHLMFLQGINQLVGQGWPSTSSSAGFPGWRFYAAGAFNDNNPWWGVMPDLMRYLQRLSFVLRQGQSSNDIAFYLPDNDAWSEMYERRVDMLEHLHKIVGEDVIAQILKAGHNVDFFNDDELQQLGKVDSGTLILGTNRYKTVILPNVESMPLETLKKLDAFARAGGKLIATRRLPDRAPGLTITDAQNQEVRDTVQHLFHDTGAPGIFAPDEKTDFAAKLAASVHPDVDFSDGKSDLGFIHRRTSDADIYFIANTGTQRRSVQATFEVNIFHAEIWDAMTGKSTSVSAMASTAGCASLPLVLEPYESKVIIFPSKDTAASGPPTATQAPLPSVSPLDISSDWQVSFNGGPVVKMDKLHSWTDDAATLHYSGVATYEKSFNLPQGFPAQNFTKLDFGPVQALPVPEGAKYELRAWINPPVREAAVVYVNGKLAGSVWCPPYQLDITHLLQPGLNQLKITVANTAINAMAGAPQPDYKALNQKYGERFKPQDMEHLQPSSSGLMGPISIISSSTP